MMKLIEVRRDNEETEILLLDVISTYDEWDSMTEEEHRQLDELLADADNTVGILVARDPDDGFMTIFPEDVIVATLDQYNFTTVAWSGKFPKLVCRLLRR